MIKIIKTFEAKEAEERDFKKNIQKPREYQKALEDYEKTAGVLDMNPKQVVLHDEFSGANQILE